MRYTIGYKTRILIAVLGICMGFGFLVTIGKTLYPLPIILIVTSVIALAVTLRLRRQF